MTADERINALLERAGQPMMVVKNPQEADEEKLMHLWHGIVMVTAKEYGGSVALYIQHLVDTIDWLEAALSNVINEREQLKKDLKSALNGDYTCWYCKHFSKETKAEPCNTCYYDAFKPNFEWRGIPESEAEHGEV